MSSLSRKATASHYNKLELWLGNIWDDLQIEVNNYVWVGHQFWEASNMRPDCSRLHIFLEFLPSKCSTLKKQVELKLNCPFCILWSTIFYRFGTVFCFPEELHGSHGPTKTHSEPNLKRRASLGQRWSGFFFAMLPLVEFLFLCTVNMLYIISNILYNIACTHTYIYIYILYIFMGFCRSLCICVVLA